MALQNGGTDANGVVALNNVAGMDQYVTLGGRTLPPDEIALVNSFNSMQAAIANVSPIPPLGAPGDDGANITAALAKNAPVVLQKGATYNIATPINFSAVPGATLYGNGATLTGAMARTGGIGNSVILAQPTLSGVGNTTLNGNAVIGARTLTVTAGAGIPNGTFIQLQSAAGASLTAYYLVIAGGTTNTLTLDRPIQEPFLNADTVKPVSVMPRSCNVIGPLTINGNGDNGLSWAGMRRGYLRDIYVDVESAASGAACLVGGIDLDVGTFAVLAESCTANGFNLAANADEFVIGIGLASCESCHVLRSSGRHATTAGILVTNCFSCVLDQCEGTDCGGTGAGIAVSGTAATCASGSNDCVVQNSYVGDSAFGVGVALATRLRSKTVSIFNSSTRALDIGTGGVASTDCVFEKINVNGGAPTTAAILVNAAAVRPVFQDISIYGITGAVNLAQVNCDFTWTGIVADGTNLATGQWFLFASGTTQSYVSRVRISGKTSLAAVFYFQVNTNGASAPLACVYFKDMLVDVGISGDTVLYHHGTCAVEIDDVVFTNSHAVVTSAGYLADGASSVLRRKGRNDLNAMSTPYACVQSDQGTFTTNQATPVVITFKDVRAAGTVPGVAAPGGNVISWMVTAAGTPAPDQTLSITANTSFSFAGKNLDTSVRGFKVLD